LIAIPTLLFISLVVFTVLAFAPGDPLSNLAGSADIPIEVRENIRRQFGLDQPFYIRYVKWLIAYLQGDWGYSFGSRIPASTLISLRIPTTLWVIGLAYLVAVLIAIPLSADGGTAVHHLRPLLYRVELRRLLAANVLHRRPAHHLVQRQTGLVTDGLQPAGDRPGRLA